MFRTLTNFVTAAAAAAGLVVAPSAMAHADEPLERAPRSAFAAEAPAPTSTMIPGSYMFHVIERYCLDLPRPDACH